MGISIEDIAKFPSHCQGWQTNGTSGKVQSYLTEEAMLMERL